MRGSMRDSAPSAAGSRLDARSVSAGMSVVGAATAIADAECA
jgi:hypothetical protein